MTDDPTICTACEHPIACAHAGCKYGFEVSTDDDIDPIEPDLPLTWATAIAGIALVALSIWVSGLFPLGFALPL